MPDGSSTTSRKTTRRPPRVTGAYPFATEHIVGMAIDHYIANMQSLLTAIMQRDPDITTRQDARLREFHLILSDYLKER